MATDMPSSQAAGRSSSSPQSLAWLVHSQDSISRSLPPDIDDKPLARQKRRRTSPEDQRILEAEYQRNPRPDKSKRTEIVKRVALGEKEVQIWFQNRRQNTRRKTQPLTTEEILHRLHTSSDSIAEPNDASPGQPENPKHEKEHDSVDKSSAPNVASISNSQPKVVTNTLSAEIEPSALKSTSLLADGPSMTRTSQSSTELAPVPAGQSDVSFLQAFSASQDSVTSFGTKTGYLANRRNASFIHSFDESSQVSTVVENDRSSFTAQSSDTRSQAQGQEKNVSASSDENKDRSLKRSSSALRLSMTFDGKAKVIGNTSPTPSPPRSQHLFSTSTPRFPKQHLQRSRTVSGANGPAFYATLDPVGRTLQRSSSGRSHDSRAWEFWCDSDARNSLAEKADQENSGSAADAIGLMRSNSRSAAAKANTNRKRPLQPSSVSHNMNKKSKLARSATATGSLPSETRKQVKGKEGKEDALDEFERPNTDSDKENWEPTNAGPRRQAPQPPSGANRRRRPVLGENTTVPSQSSSLDAMLARESRDKHSTIDDEVAKFMSSGSSVSGGSSSSSSGRTSLSNGEDLDCVQGLLSLSQGIWN